MYGITSKPARILVAGLVVLGVVTVAASAIAHDDRHGVYRKYDKDHRWHGYDRRYWKKYGHHGVTVYSWKPTGHWAGYRGRTVRAACHPVVGNGRDHFGRRAKFGGTLCYDRTGQAYIKPGSRHVIRYF